ncbi:MAG: RND transporter, partial [Candidatus Hydrogenedentes bacterium]|nr:RND transporter [Candidatus Hydrogenedentota bacterium]
MQFNKAGRWFRAAGGLTLPLLLMACVTGPDYRRPELNPPAAYKSATDAEQAQPGLAEDWWRLFDDPDLDALMQEALSSNLDLKAAMARVEQSRAAAR